MLVLAAIFKLEDGKLHLCIPPFKNATQRPTGFDAKGASVAILRRAGKDDKKDDEKKTTSAYNRQASELNLKQLALSMHSHVDATKRLPPAASSGADGKPLLSWRVAILPYLDEIDLYKQFDLTKPWDDPQNMKLIPKMPKVFVVPGVEAKEGMTHYRTLVGPGTLLNPVKGPDGKLQTKYSLFNAPDGTSNVIIFVEAKEPTIWTKPDDLPFDPKLPLPKFGVSPGGFQAAFADGSVRWIPANVTEKALRPYLTADNGTPREPLEKDKSEKFEKFDKGDKDKFEKGKEDKDKVRDKDKEKDLNKEPKLKGPGPVDQAKTDVARTQIAVLMTAVQAYKLKNGEFPTSLDVLLEKDDKGAGPYLQNRDALTDPWKKRYQYDPSGPLSGGKQPDIWTVSPFSERIGSWDKVDAGKEKRKDAK
jgi:hypothetical protein